MDHNPYMSLTNSRPPAKSGLTDEGLSAIQALYAADRADGTGIYNASTQLVAGMVTYAAVAFAVLGSDLLDDAQWIRGLIAVPLWGLTAYLVTMNALMRARVTSINILEKLIRQHAGASLQEVGLLGSAAGDFASNIRRQPWPLRLPTVISYVALLAGVVGLTWFSIHSVWGESWHWYLLIMYAALAVTVLGSFGYVYSLDFGRQINAQVPATEEASDGLYGEGPEEGA